MSLTSKVVLHIFQPRSRESFMWSQDVVPFGQMRDEKFKYRPFRKTFYDALMLFFFVQGYLTVEIELFVFVAEK